MLAAKQAGARWRILHVTCADAVAEERLARSDPGHPAKNRDPALYRRIKQHFEPILQAKLEVDTTLGIDAAVGGGRGLSQGRGIGRRVDRAANRPIYCLRTYAGVAQW